MSRIKPAEVRYYIDADLLGLARVLAKLRPDVTYPGDPGAVIHKRQRPPCPVADPSVKDTEWIPEVARRGWVIVTRDRHIQEHRLEIAAIRDNNAKMVALVGHDARGVFDPTVSGMEPSADLIANRCAQRFCADQDRPEVPFGATAWLRMRRQG